MKSIRIIKIVCILMFVLIASMILSSLCVKFFLKNEYYVTTIITYSFYFSLTKMQHEIFDPSNSKYRCCCGCCHVKTGTTIICIVSLAIYILLLIYRVIFYPSPTFLAIGVVLILLNIAIIGSALFAVKTEQPKWIIPLLAFMIITITLLTIQMLYSLYTYFAYNQVQMLPFDEKLLFEDEPYLKTKDNDPSTVITTLIIDFIISLLIQCWLFFVVYRCYQYLMAKEKAEKTPTFPSPNFYQYY